MQVFVAVWVGVSYHAMPEYFSSRHDKLSGILWTFNRSTPSLHKIQNPVWVSKKKDLPWSLKPCLSGKIINNKKKQIELLVLYWLRSLNTYKIKKSFEWLAIRHMGLKCDYLSALIRRSYLKRVPFGNQKKVKCMFLPLIGRALAERL